MKTTNKFSMTSIALLGLLFATPMAEATTIDFSAIAGSSGSIVNQSFGDSAEVDVTYATLNGGNNWGQFATVSSNQVRYWDSAYSGDQAVYSDGDGKKFQVTLAATPGRKFTSMTFDFGAWPNLSRTIDYKAYDALWQQIGGANSFFLTGAAGGGGLVSFALDTAAVVFQFGDDFNVGLNAISFETVGNGDPNPVPIPAGIILAGTALAGLAGTGRMKNRSKKL